MQPATITLDRITGDLSPRENRLDDDHVEVLTTVESWPAITVWARGDDLIVLDGVHRIEAARRRGDTHIDVRFEEHADERSARLRAYELNGSHGRTLTLAERKQWARMLLDDGDVSNREIGRLTGVSEATVRRLREPSTATGDAPASTKHPERDGEPHTPEAAEDAAAPPSARAKPKLEAEAEPEPVQQTHNQPGGDAAAGDGDPVATLRECVQKLASLPETPTMMRLLRDRDEDVEGLVTVARDYLTDLRASLRQREASAGPPTWCPTHGEVDNPRAHWDRVDDQWKCRNAPNTRVPA